jgi:uncharacterized repeat protein (TIGR01451 family)
MVSCATATVLLISGTSVALTLSAPEASATGTALFNQPFHDNTVDGSAGSVALPAVQSGTNSACLTAVGNATANPLASCTTTPTDPQGSGTLRFTSNAGGKVGAVFANGTVPTSAGLDITFNLYQWGSGASGADGTGFVLAAANPADPVIPSVAGPSGGSLGYSAQASNSLSGLTDGYAAVGLDEHGNFSNPTYEGSGCTNPPNINGTMPGQVVLRGPGNGTVGYCALASSAATSSSPSLTLRASTRAASKIPVEVAINPTSSLITTSSGLAVPAGDIGFAFTPVGGSLTTKLSPLPTAAGLYPSSWVNASGIPKQLAFGWVASTGASVDYHEIDSAVVTTLNPAPVLAVSQTSYAAATLSPGSPVTYTVAASSSGATENSPVTVTETLPSGVVPVGAEGTGWVCGAPSGQQISCTNSTSPFTSGTITVNGVVNTTGVTPATIQSSTTAVASSSDADPAKSSTAPAGTVPAAPSVTGVTPTNGAAGGGNDVTVSGTGLSGATAIDVGTAAEFQAGTPATLNLCAASAPGCFTVTSGTSLDISSMPAHAAGAVQVSVVSLGIAGTGAYTYNSGPALLFPAPPGGEVGVAYSDQLTETGGTSPFTWSVSSGTLPGGVTLGASTGLLSGTPTTAGSYSFTVKVTDSASLSATEATSITVTAGVSATFAAPPSGEINTAYTDTLTAAGGTAPYTWSVSSGSLPTGITLSSAGVLAGTPTTAGNYPFTVKVTDQNGGIATTPITLVIAAGPALNFAAPSYGEVGSPYSDTLTVSGGTGPYTWSVSSGSLPAGITLGSTTGTLSGTPTAPGTSTFTVQVTDADGQSATKATSLAIISGPALSFPAPPSGEIGTAYSDTLTVSGGSGPYTWSVSSGSLPAGITLGSTTGTLSGTPTAPGTSNFTVQVTDTDGHSATEATTLAIISGPGLSFPAPPSGEIGTAYSDTLTASGGTGPYTWSVSSGSLPAGITLGSGTGTLSGTPTAAATFHFTVQVTDADGQSATDATSLAVNPSTALSTSVASVSFGKTVTFTATVTPAAASGSVTFSDLLSTGPQNGQVVTLGTAVLSGGTASLTVDLPAFNTNTVTATYSGDSSYASVSSGTAGVQVNAYGGEVIINQFRLSGPGGAGDQYAELYNAGPAVSLAGFTLAPSSGARVTVPSNAPILASRGAYLITGAGYTLGAVAPSDLQAASLGTGGLQVIAPDGLGTVTDAAGSAGASSGFYSGTPLPALSGTPADQYAWVRLENAGAPGNSGSNAADFQLVSTTGGVIGGVQSCLGSPSPQATRTPAQDNADFLSALLDSARGAHAAPNFVYVHGTPGLLTIRRTITNTSPTAITSAEIRITSLSEVNGPAEPGVTAQPPTPAQLRLINPATPTSQITITGGHTVTVQNLSVDAPASYNPASPSTGGGGLDTTLAIPLPGGSLAVGASVSIALSFAVDRHGPYWFGYDIDALAAPASAPASAPDHAPARHSRTHQPAAPPSQLLRPGTPDRYATGHGVLP